MINIKKLKPKEQLAHIDLNLVLDYTSSMSSERKVVINIASNIINQLENSPTAQKYNMTLHFAVVLFRDHTDSWIIRNYAFTRNGDEIKKFLKKEKNAGGGDTPECVGSGLNTALNMNWKQEAEKIVVLIGDAPAHGYSNNKNDKVCCKNDPVEIARKFNNGDITLFAIQAHLSGNTYDPSCEKLWKNLSKITGGAYYRLENVNDLLKKLMEIVEKMAKEIEAQIIEMEKYIDGDISDIDEETLQKAMRKLGIDDARLIKKEKCEKLSEIPPNSVCVRCSRAETEFEINVSWKAECGAFFHDGCLSYLPGKVCPNCNSLIMIIKHLSTSKTTSTSTSESPWMARGQTSSTWTEEELNKVAKSRQPAVPLSMEVWTEEDLDKLKHERQKEGLKVTEWKEDEELKECPKCGYYLRKGWGECPICNTLVDF